MREIKIDFDNPGLPQRLDVVENDAQSRFFKAVLYKDGKAYTAPSGAKYSIMYRGFGPQNEGWYDTIKDGAGKRAACSVSGNVVTCEIARQALRVPGHVSVVLCVTGSNGYMLHGWPIDCNCRNDSYTSGTSVESFFYITQITNASWTSAIQTWEELKNIIDPTLSLSGKAADAAKVGEAVSQLKEDLDYYVDVATYKVEKGLNLFDTSTLTNGYYKAYNTGEVKENAAFSFGYIECEPNLKYTVSKASGNKYLGQVCFCTKSDEYISGIIMTANEQSLLTPDNCYKIYFSDETNQFQQFKVEVGNEPTGFYPYIKPYTKPEGMTPLVLQLNKNLYVNSVWRLIALAGNIANEKNPVVVEIPEGTYSQNDVLYNSSEYGWFVPDFVTLRGTGDKNKTILLCRLDEQSSLISTVNLSNTCGLENLTVVGENTRYALHDDFANSNNDKYERNIKNCVFRVKNGYYGPAYGAGTKQGADWRFENCKFITDKSQCAFYVHSNVNFEKPCNVIIENCDFITRASTESIHIGCMASNQKNTIILKGCNVSSIRIDEIISGCGIDWELSGYGNNEPVLYAPADYDYYFNDEVSWLYNQHSLGYGSPVMRNNALALKASDGKRFYGITIGLSDSNNRIKVKHKGYVNALICGFESLTCGTKVYLDTENNALTTNQTDFLIGICDVQNHIRLLN